MQRLHKGYIAFSQDVIVWDSEVSLTKDSSSTLYILADSSIDRVLKLWIVSGLPRHNPFADSAIRASPSLGPCLRPEADSRRQACRRHY